MAITFSGLATGLDTDSIITSLMEVERAPVDRLEAQKESEAERLKAYGQFKSYLEDLKDAASAISLTSQVKNSAVTLSSESYFSASLNGASDGSYQVAVGQLAQVQKTVSDGWSSSSAALLGTGTITINGTDITIDSTNNSLSGLAAAINEQSDTLGVKASVINDGDPTNPYRLMLTGNDTGTSFTVSSNLVDASSNPIAFNTTDTASAQQAELYVDGIKIVSDSNTIKDAIPGITFNLDAVSPVTSTGPPPVYETVSMTIAPDTAPVKEKITEFVSSYNRVMDWILSGYEEFGNTPEPTTGDSNAASQEELLGSVLRGDATINSIKRGLQNILSSVIDGPETLTTLGQLGISTQLNGKLALDKTTMEAAVDANQDDLVALLSGTDTTKGVMKQLNSYLGEQLLGANSFYSQKKELYTMSVNRIDDQIALQEERLEKREATLRLQFNNMETLVSGLNSQSEFLLQQFTNISKLS